MSEEDGFYGPLDSDDNIIPFGTPGEALSTLVEITGPNGEYLARGILGEGQVQTQFAGTFSISVNNTFGFATRWINGTFAASDYTWSLSGTGATGTDNADGTFTVTNVDGSAVLTLTNNTLGTRNVAQLTLVP